MPTQFQALPVGAEFEFNGNRWVKQSTRTAYLVEFDRWFYLGMSDIVRKV